MNLRLITMRRSSSLPRTGRGLSLLALLAGGAAALSACGHVATVTHGPAGGTTIPWSDLPGGGLEAPSPPPAAVACATPTVQLSSHNAGAYHGDAVEDILLANDSAAACYFPGAPAMTVALASGAHQSVSAGGFGSTRLDAQPAQQLHLTIGTPATCSTFGTPQPASSLSVSLPGGGAITVNDLNLDVQCGAPTVLLFDVIDPTDAALNALPDTPASGLSATLDAPATASAGSTYLYTVTLTNPTASDISLATCPSYTEGLNQGGTTVAEQTLLLNCAAAPSIPANSSLTFEMHLAVPSTLSAGAFKLSWSLQVPHGASVGQGVDIQ